MTTSTRSLHTHHRILLGLGLSTAGVLALALAGNAQTAGTLDLNFSGDGIQINDLSGAGETDVADAVVIMDDGKILVMGTASPEDSFTDIYMAIYQPDGILLESALFDFSPGLFILEGVGIEKAVVQDETMYYVLCYAQIGGNNQFKVARFNSDLELDADWSSDGLASANFEQNGPCDVCRPYDIAVQSDGKVVVVGAWEQNVALARFNADGSLDPTFSFDGILTTDIPESNEESGNAVAIDANGRILVAGNRQGTGVPSNYGFVARYNPDGTLDPSFGSSGFQNILYGTGAGPGGSLFGTCRVNDMVLMANGKILLAGQSWNNDADNSAYGVVRLNADGSYDTDLSGDGKLRFDFVAVDDFNIDLATSITLDSSERIVLAGSANSTGEIGLARLTQDGTLDMSFGVNGLVQTDLGSTHSAGQVIVDAEGRIIVAGGVRPTGTIIKDSFLVRYYGINVGVLEFTIEAAGPNIYPNPITESTTFTYTLNERTVLSIELQDLQGRTIASFLNGKATPAGMHRQTVTIPAELAHGNYLLVFSSPKGKMSVQVSK